MFRSRVAAAVSIVLTLCACGGKEGSPAVRSLAVPANPGSHLPSVTSAGNGDLVMVWIDESGEGPPRLLGARYDGSAWSEPALIVEDERLFVNWADFADVSALPDGSLAVHWLMREGSRSHTYGIRLGILNADWSPLSETLRPHSDRTEGEHGFVSMFAEGASELGLVWLDGRRMEGSSGTMQLRYRKWTPRGLSEELVLDDDVCTCCQTDAVRVEGEPFVVYRDHDAGEIRDISYVRRSGGSWSAPRPLYRDGWKIAGCPVNGPAVDARERSVAVAWFTRADDEPRVLLALSADAGRSFAEPVRIDDGDPLGRVDVKVLPGGKVVVSWVEKAPHGASIRLRAVDAAGTAREAVTVAATKALRDSGFPRMALAGDRLYLAWTVASSPSAVELALVDF